MNKYFCTTGIYLKTDYVKEDYMRKICGILIFLFVGGITPVLAEEPLITGKVPVGQNTKDVIDIV